MTAQYFVYEPAGEWNPAFYDMPDGVLFGPVPFEVVAATETLPFATVVAAPRPGPPGFIAVTRSIADTPIVSFDTPHPTVVVAPPRPTPGVSVWVTHPTASDNILRRPTIAVTPRSTPAGTVWITRSTAPPPAPDVPPQSFVVAPASLHPTTPPSIVRMVADTPIVSFDTPPIADLTIGPTPRPGSVFITGRSTADPVAAATPPVSRVFVPTQVQRFGNVIINLPRVEEAVPSRPLVVAPPRRRQEPRIISTSSPAEEIRIAPPSSFIIANPNRPKVNPPIIHRPIFAGGVGSVDLSPAILNFNAIPLNAEAGMVISVSVYGPPPMPALPCSWDVNVTCSQEFWLTLSEDMQTIAAEYGS